MKSRKPCQVCRAMRKRRGVSDRAFRRGAMIGVQGYPCGWCRNRAERMLEEEETVWRIRKEEDAEALAMYESWHDAKFYD